jgi:hypothetical protein
MDNDIVWKCVIFFNFLFPLLWILFYTFHPSDIMEDDDFILPGATNRGGSGAKNNRDSRYSVPGRSLIFLISILAALGSGILFYLYLRYVDTRPLIKCPKGASTMEDCALITEESDTSDEE